MTSETNVMDTQPLPRKIAKPIPRGQGEIQQGVFNNYKYLNRRCLVFKNLKCRQTENSSHRRYLRKTFLNRLKTLKIEVNISQKYLRRIVGCVKFRTLSLLASLFKERPPSQSWFFHYPILQFNRKLSIPPSPSPSWRTIIK